MHLKTLALKNFRKFKNEFIEFPDGVIGVIGLNGAGKSTIFEAIAWVLYGPVAARTSADEIKRQDATSSEPCRVELDFVFEGENIRIFREMRGKSNTTNAAVTVNGKVAATSADVVTKYVHKKIGMDFKSFFTSIYAKQKELNSLSIMNASERRPLILRMLGIDSLDDVIKEIRSDKKIKESYIEKLNESLFDQYGKDKKDLYLKKQEEKNKEKINIKKEIEKLKNILIKEKKELKVLEKNYKDSKKEYEKLSREKEDIAEKKNEFENYKKLKDEIGEIEKIINERNKKIDLEKKKLRDFENFKKELDKTNTRFDKIEKDFEKTLKSIEKNDTLIDRIGSEIKEIEEKRKKIKKIGPNAKCPTCERTLDVQYDTLLKKYVKEIKIKSKEIEDIHKENEENISKKVKFEREKTALKKKKSYIEGEIRKKEIIETSIKHIITEKEKEEKTFFAKNKQLSKIGKISFKKKDYESIKNKVDKSYEKYQKDLEKLNLKKDKISDLNLDYEKTISKEKLLDQEIKNISIKIKELIEFKNKIKEEKNALRYIDMLSDLMNNFRTFLISRIRPTLSSYASELYQELTNGKYSEIELDENYDVLIYDKGENFKIERFSGGEEDLANLCLRLAISEVISERSGGIFNFIILDEIFGSQDNIRRQNILKALNNLSSKFRQIFLITHIEEVKNYVENIIQIKENEEGTSSILIE